MIHKVKEKMRSLNHNSNWFNRFYIILSRIKVKSLSLLNDEQYIKIKYKASTGETLNLDNPKTFNEKLQWLKLYNHNSLYTQLVDKYAVRDFVKDRIGENYLTKCYGVFDSFEDINFDELPNSFVLKCTHDCGSVVVCKEKRNLDIESLKKKITKALSHNYYYQGREWPYKNVKPRIIIEEYLEDRTTNDLYDYKLFCFNGIAKTLFISTGRHSGDMRLDFFDLDFNKLPFERGYPNSDLTIHKPQNFELMVALAEKLSENIPFVRVDFYDVEGRIVFGEMTFFPGGGMEAFKPKEWDYTLGSWISLPEEKQI